jgi:hypothetical protein
MVKANVYTLASRALRVNQEMAAHLTRIQSGFLASKNIEQAQQVTQSLHEMLREMQTALKAHAHDPPPRNYVPLK